MTRRVPSVALLSILLAACAPPAAGSQAPDTSRTTPAAATATPVMPIPAISPEAPAQQQEPPLPAPREELAAAVLDRILYVIGGYDASGRDTNTVFTYSGSWSQGPSLPQALDHPAAAALLGRLYVVGGFAAGQASGATYRLAQDHWERLASLHHARAALALIPLEGRLYALAGRDSRMASVAVPEVYDPSAGSWSDLPVMPAPRHHAAGFAYLGMACVAGGKFPYTARVDCFDPASTAWSRLPDLPQATSGAGADVLGGELVVAGGEGAAVVPWLYWLVGQTWQRQSMLLPRHGMQLATLNGRTWACGGGMMAGLHPTGVCTSIGPAS